jgi:predicted metal-dependent HD superfamily phosphohydrolase
MKEERFSSLFERLDAQGDPRPIFERLRAAYAEPHRAYHNAHHIDACLRWADEVGANDEVEAALWFHDAVYDTRARDNEEKSAELVLESLRGAEGAGRIAAHVRATKSHQSTSPDTALVLDIDLSILGADEETYARFEQQIREEYSWVDPAAYAAGRSAVLSGFLARERIYVTDDFRDRLEEQARRNLEWALSLLR